LVVSPRSCLQLTADENRLALIEILANKLCLRPPSDNGNEVTLVVTVFAIFAIDRYAEGAYRYSACALFQFRIGCHITDKNNFIE
jgi:hypothetical protein